MHLTRTALMLAGLLWLAAPAHAEPDMAPADAAMAVETGNAVLRLLEALEPRIAGGRQPPLQELAVVAATGMGLPCHVPDEARPWVVCELGPRDARGQLHVEFIQPWGDRFYVAAQLRLTPRLQVLAQRFATQALPAWQVTKTEACRTSLWRKGPGPQTQTALSFEVVQTVDVGCTGVFSDVLLTVSWTPFDFPPPSVR